MYCHVGCSFDDVACALGEPVASDLAIRRSWPVRKTGASTGARSDVIGRLVAHSILASGTAAARYLAGRGITLAPPPDIRFLPQHRHALNKALTMELARCEFVDKRDNVIALGPSGTGKTHAD